MACGDLVVWTKRQQWEIEVARPRRRIAALVPDDCDSGDLSKSAANRRFARASELASNLHLKPSLLPADGALRRTLISSSTIADVLGRDSIRSCYVWQANSRPAIRAILESLNEPGVPEFSGGHAWTVMGDRLHYRRPGAYILAASRRQDTPAHGVLFASRGLLVEPFYERDGPLPTLRIELDYVYVCRRMRRRGIACALATAVVEQAVSDLQHLTGLLAAWPKRRDRRLAITLLAESHTEGGNEFVNAIFAAIEGYMPFIFQGEVTDCGLIDLVDWL